MRVLHPGRMEFGDVGFCGGRKTGEPGEKPSEQGENQQQTQPTYGTGLESNPGHIGGSRALLLLCYPYSLGRLRGGKYKLNKTKRSRWNF